MSLPFARPHVCSAGGCKRVCHLPPAILLACPAGFLPGCLVGVGLRRSLLGPVALDAGLVLPAHTTVPPGPTSAPFADRRSFRKPTPPALHSRCSPWRPEETLGAADCETRRCTSPSGQGPSTGLGQPGAGQQCGSTQPLGGQESTGPALAGQQQSIGLQGHQPQGQAPGLPVGMVSQQQLEALFESWLQKRERGMGAQGRASDEGAGSGAASSQSQGAPGTGLHMQVVSPRSQPGYAGSPPQPQGWGSAAPAAQYGEETDVLVPSPVAPGGAAPAAQTNLPGGCGGQIPPGAGAGATEVFNLAAADPPYVTVQPPNLQVVLLEQPVGNVDMPPGAGDQGLPPGAGDQGPPLPDAGQQGPPPYAGPQPPPGAGQQGPLPGAAQQDPLPGAGQQGDVWDPWHNRNPQLGNIVPQPAVPPYLPGDWRCICGYHCYARNGRCKKCGREPRDEDRVPFNEGQCTVCFRQMGPRFQGACTYCRRPGHAEAGGGAAAGCGEGPAADWSTPAGASAVRPSADGAYRGC